MTAEELLAAMAEQEPLAEDGTYCTIDPETRVITIPPEYQLLGVESDEKAERIYFKCPKIVGDDIDLSKLALRVNFRNAGQVVDQYLVDDVAVDGDNITFSWLLSRRVTQYEGDVNFIVCAVRVHDDATITNEWNTTIATATVLEGLEADYWQEEEDQARDLLTELLDEIEKKGEEVKESIAAPSDEQVNNAVEKYFEENPGSTVAVDETLTKEGFAADAKAVGDLFKKVEKKINEDLFINVKNFGINPNTGKDISDTLKKIILLYPNKALYFPTGVYTIEKTIEVSSDTFFYLENDAEFTGKSDNQFCFKFSNCSFAMLGGYISKGSEEDFEARNLTGEVLNSGIFEFTNCNYILVENSRLKFNSTPNTFKFKDCKNIGIKNCIFSNFLYGAIVFYDACKNVYVKNSLFEHGKRSNQQQYNYPIASGFSTYSSQVGYIENYLVENCFMEDCDWEGCDCHGGKNIKFSNLRMHNCNRFVTVYSDNRPILPDYDFSDVIVENCYFENDDDYVPVAPDASIYCNGRYNRKFRNMVFKNVTVVNPVCRDLEKNSYGAFYANYNENVRLENVKFKATKYYDDFQYIMQLLGSRNLKIDGVTIEGFPASDVTAPIRLKYCTGECENLQVFNNNKQYSCIYIAVPSVFKFGKNIGGNVTRPFYTERKYHLQNAGEVIPFIFPYLAPSNMYGTYETTQHRGYGLTLSEGEEQVVKNVVVSSGNTEIQLSNEEKYISVIGTSITVKVGQNTLDTVITDYREGYFTVADIPNFEGEGTVTINRLLRLEIKLL